MKLYSVCRAWSSSGHYPLCRMLSKHDFCVVLARRATVVLLPVRFTYLSLIALCLTSVALAPGCSQSSDDDDATTTGTVSPTPDVVSEPWISVSASSLDFGTVLSSAPADQQLEITNAGPSTLLLTVTLPDNPSGQYSISADGQPVPDELGGETSVVLTVTFKPLVEGEAPGILRVDSTDPVTPRIDISLTATGAIDPEQQDIDGDGFTSAQGDCDDHAAGIYPGAPEPCDGVDNDCDTEVDEEGMSTFYSDRDGDSFGDPSTAFQACTPGIGVVSNGDDCDDADAAIYPGAEEVCDGMDNDCDGESDEDVRQTFFEDVDGDGYGDDTSSATGCVAPDGYVSEGGDCATGEFAIFPGALEVCDGLDNDCDGEVDQGLTLTFYRDADGDGFGVSEISESNDIVQACEAPDGYVDNAEDCNDLAPVTNPEALEVCDTFDNDCDGEVDEGLELTFYQDTDGDGYGDGNSPVKACATSGGIVESSNDCNDHDRTVYPNALEICDSKDNDCDGGVDEDGLSAWYLDVDGDGFGDPAVHIESCNELEGYAPNGDDCDDRDAATYPGATERCNNRDDNCDGEVDEGVLSTWYLDADQDGYGAGDDPIAACNKPGSKYTTQPGDCNDLDPATNPAATEVCDARDNDCDGEADEDVLVTFYADADSDGAGDADAPSFACTPPSGTVANNGDCDDTNESVYPGAVEICDGLDNNCDTQIDEDAKSTWYFDGDGDGYGGTATLEACFAPEGYVGNARDCNDAASNTFPGANELCDGKDNDCDGSIDEDVKTTFYVDADGDTYGDPYVSNLACAAGGGLVINNTDCNDKDASIHPGATETCNELDDDCDGSVDEEMMTTFYRDADEDGYGVASNTTAACVMPEGYAEVAGDCRDSDASTYPGAPERCDSRDNNCDGRVDEAGYPGQVLYYVDEDDDGYGAEGPTVWACSKPDGYAQTLGDCDDGDPDVYPGAPEQCNGVDANCDGSVATPPAPPHVSTNSPVCNGDSLTLSASSISQATYAWTGPNGFVSSAQNPTISAMTPAGAGTYTVVATVGTCTTTPVRTVVEVNDPSADFAWSPESALPGDTLVFTPVLTGGEYAWSFESGTPASSTEEDPAVVWDAVGEYAAELTVTYQGCSSTSVQIVMIGYYSSCDQVLQAEPGSPDGVYSIDPDGPSGNPAFDAYCDMTSSDGGWTLLTWTAMSSTSSPYGVPYPGIAYCPGLNCVRGSGVPPASIPALFKVSNEFAIGQSVSSNMKDTFDLIGSYQYAGRYIYGSLAGLSVNYGSTSCSSSSSGFAVGTFSSIVNASTYNGTAVYLAQYLAYGSYNYSGDSNSYIWNVGVPTAYCNGSGSIPGSWMGTWSSRQYGPGMNNAAGSYSVWVR